MRHHQIVLTLEGAFESTRCCSKKQRLRLGLHKVRPGGRTFGEVARGLDGGLARCYAEVVVAGGLVARRQVAGEIIALLVEGAA